MNIAKTYPSLSNRRELELSLPSEDEVEAGFLPNRYMYLNPINHGQVLLPVIKLKKCDFGRSIPEIRIRLGLFLQHDKDIKAIGYRFETPEGPATHHHYFHLQMIRGFEIRSLLPPVDCLKWMPDTAPTFPLDVNGSVKLLLSLLISLYGVRDIGTMVRDASLRGRIGRYLGEMSCHSFPPFDWYWKVTTGGIHSQDLYYKTAKEPQEFKDFFGRKHPSGKIVGITQGFYNLQSKSKRRIHK